MALRTIITAVYLLLALGVNSAAAGSQKSAIAESRGGAVVYTGQKPSNDGTESPTSQLQGGRLTLFNPYGDPALTIDRAGRPTRYVPHLDPGYVDSTNLPDGHRYRLTPGKESHERDTLRRLDGSGKPVRSFADEGTLRLPLLTKCTRYPHYYNVWAAPDGTVTIMGCKGARRYLDDGSVDSSFGNGGELLTTSQDVVQLTDGSLRVFELHGETPELVALHAGAGPAGPQYGDETYATWSMDRSTGGIMALVNVYVDARFQSRYMARFNPDGSRDMGFGTEGQLGFSGNWWTPSKVGGPIGYIARFDTQGLDIFPVDEHGVLGRRIRARIPVSGTILYESDAPDAHWSELSSGSGWLDGEATQLPDGSWRIPVTISAMRFARSQGYGLTGMTAYAVVGLKADFQPDRTFGSGHAHRLRVQVRMKPTGRKRVLWLRTNLPAACVAAAGRPGQKLTDFPRFQGMTPGRLMRVVAIPRGSNRVHVVCRSFLGRTVRRTVRLHN